MLGAVHDEIVRAELLIESVYHDENPLRSLDRPAVRIVAPEHLKNVVGGDAVGMHGDELVDALAHAVAYVEANQRRDLVAGGATLSHPAARDKPALLLVACQRDA